MERLVYQFYREALDGYDGLVYLLQCLIHPQVLTFMVQ